VQFSIHVDRVKNDGQNALSGESAGVEASGQGIRRRNERFHRSHRNVSVIMLLLLFFLDVEFSVTRRFLSSHWLSYAIMFLLN
jgi:hypothetical protein